MEYSFSTTGSW